jgi:hypothetical protein
MVIQEKTAKSSMSYKTRLKSAGGVTPCGGLKVRHLWFNQKNVHKYGAMERDTTSGAG